jgi:zinc and cadmium transporter
MYAIISVFLVSAISLVGIFTLSLKMDRRRRILVFLVSFAVGGLFGDAFIHLIPESFERLGANLTTSLYLVSGILLFFVLEKFLLWRHCHIPPSEEHLHPVVTMNLVGDAAHNFTDGIIIGVGYAVSIPIGITTTLAVVLHEIPQEMGDFGVLVHGGLSVKRALAYNFLSALTAVLGTIVSLVIGSNIEVYALSLLPMVAGGFIYIAGSDLVPELHHDVKVSTSFLQFVLIILGVGVMALLVVLE